MTRQMTIEEVICRSIDQIGPGSVSELYFTLPPKRRLREAQLLAVLQAMEADGLIKGKAQGGGVVIWHTVNKPKLPPLSEVKTREGFRSWIERKYGTLTIAGNKWGVPMPKISRFLGGHSLSARNVERIVAVEGSFPIDRMGAP